MRPIPLQFRLPFLQAPKLVAVTSLMLVQTGVKTWILQRTIVSVFIPIFLHLTHHNQGESLFKCINVCSLKSDCTVVDEICYSTIAHSSLCAKEGTKRITVYTTWRSMICMHLKICIIGIAIRTLIIIEQS